MAEPGPPDDARTVVWPLGPFCRGVGFTEAFQNRSSSETQRRGRHSRHIGQARMMYMVGRLIIGAELFRMSRVVAVAVAVLVGSLCAPAAPVSASQQHSDPKAEARLHFERGVALAKNGQYAEAITAFNRAYSASPHFAVLFNLGQAYAALGQPVHAADSLRRYLTEGGAQVPPSRRSQVEADLAEYERQISKVTVRAAVDGAAIRIDQTEIGRTPLAFPARLAPGAHVIEAQMAGYRPWSQQFTVGPGEARTLEVRLERDSAEAAAPRPEPVHPAPQSAGVGVAPPAAAGNDVGANAVAGALQAQPAGDAPPAPPEVGPSRWLPGLVVLGAGIITAGAATGVLIWNYGRNQAHEDEVAKFAPPNAPPTDEQAKELNEQADSIRNVSYVNVALALGSAALVTTGAVLLWRASNGAASEEHHRGSSQQLVIGPGIVGWRAAF